MNPFKLIPYLLIIICLVSCTKPSGTPGTPTLTPPPPSPPPVTQNIWNQQGSFIFNKLWGYCYGGSNQDGAFVNTNIVRTSDSGYVTAAYTWSNDGDISGNHGSEDFWVIKIDANGNKVWSKVFGGSQVDLPYSILGTRNGGFIVLGHSQSSDSNLTANKGLSDAWIIKLDGNGNLTWEKNYGGKDIDQASYISETKDGNYLIAGASYSNDGDLSGNHGKADVWLFKIDGNGNLLWSKVYGGSDVDASYGIASISTGGYAILAYSNSNDGDVQNNHGSGDTWIIKVDEQGNKLWSLCVGGSQHEIPGSITSDSTGSVYFTGSTASMDGDISYNRGSPDLFVCKVDINGNKKWYKTYGGSGTDYGNSILFTQDKQLLIGGFSSSIDGDLKNQTGSGCWLFKLDTDGNGIWQTIFGGASSSVDALYQLANGNYVLAGTTSVNNGTFLNLHGSSDLFFLSFKDH
jgi:hypothetical protein